MIPQLSGMDYRLFSLSILVPQLIIWFIAFYGYDKLRAYSKLICKEPDGKGVASLVTGTMIIAFSLPLSSIGGGIVSTITANFPDYTTIATIIRTYFSLLAPLVGFLFISVGAHRLALLSEHRPHLRTMQLITLLVVAISVLYCYVTFSSSDLSTLYRIPEWLVALTITIPHIFTWFIGVQAAYELHLYSKNAPGTIYRKTWNRLATGIGSIVILQSVVQYVSTVTIQFSSLRLARLYVIIYVLLALLAFAYLIVALGARRLQKIEEV